jgi:hypothetical protein
MPAFADTKAAASSSGEERLEELFKANLRYRSASESDAVVVAEGHEGVYIGSGDGTVSGDRLRGTLLGIAFIPRHGAANPCLRASIFAVSIRRGSSIPRTELESDLMAEVMAFAVLKNTKRT